MSYFTGYLLLAFALIASLYAFARASPSSVANFIRSFGPLVLVGVGVLLTVFGRGSIGVPIVTVGIALWARFRSVKPISGPSSAPQKSMVRSAWLEMELDHDSGELEGFVLTGKFDGKFLNDLSDAEVLELYEMLETDAESAELLAAYLDRRLAGWREDLNAGADAGESAAAGSGPMTKEEAYQILGLPAGAGSNEIKKAHRRLMKQMHPDHGGSTFLAAKINQAKDVLLN